MSKPKIYSKKILINVTVNMANYLKQTSINLEVSVADIIRQLISEKMIESKVEEIQEINDSMAIEMEQEISEEVESEGGADFDWLN